MYRTFYAPVTITFIALSLIAGCTSKEEIPPTVNQLAEVEAAQLPDTEETISSPQIEKTKEITKEEKNFESEVTKSQPLDPNPQTISIANRNLVPVRCSLKGIEFLGDDSFDLLPYLEVGTDGKLYVVHQEKYIHRFNISGDDSSCILTLDTSFGKNDKFRFDNDLNLVENTLYASAMIFKSDQNELRKIEVEGDKYCPSKLLVHPKGQSALGYSNKKLFKVKLSESGCDREEWSEFPDMFNSIDTITWIGESDFAIGGTLAGDEGGWIVVIFDANGREKLRFGYNEEKRLKSDFGWVHAIKQCGQDYCVLDSNFRELTIWDSSGNRKALIDLDNDLFGLDYAWIPDFEIDSGYAWFSTIQRRKDSKVYEGNIYRVGGL